MYSSVYLESPARKGCYKVLTELKLVRVDYMPVQGREIPGELYYSERFGLMVHLCPCGNVGCKSITPVNRNGEHHAWKLTFQDGQPTLEPSLLNPCGTHYYIEQGKIRYI